MSLGFDQLIKFWSLECVNGIFLQLELKLPFKTYATNFDFPHLLICSIDSTFAILNLKTLPRVDIPNEYLKSNI